MKILSKKGMEYIYKDARLKNIFSYTSRKIIYVNSDFNEIIFEGKEYFKINVSTSSDANYVIYCAYMELCVLSLGYVENIEIIKEK